MQDKPFWQKSTFWINIVMMVSATVMCYVGKIDSTIWMAAMGLGGTGYTIKEGYVNRGTSNVEKT